MTSIGGSNKLLSLREVAEILGYAENTVYNEWRTWGLPFYRVGGGDKGGLRLRERDLWNWFEKRAAALSVTQDARNGTLMSRGPGDMQRRILAELGRYGGNWSGEGWHMADWLEVGVLGARLDERDITVSPLDVREHVTESDRASYRRALRNLVKSGHVEMGWRNDYMTPSGRPGEGALRKYRLTGGE